MPFEKKQATCAAPSIDPADYERWRKLTAWWREYPDYWYDAIESPDASFSLNYYQRIYLRSMTRIRMTFIDGTRGTTKTYLDTAAKIHRCVFYPGTVETLTAPSKEQARTLVLEALKMLEHNYPPITHEYVIVTNTRDEIVLEFYNTSRFRTIINGPGAQGGNHTNLSVEEISQDNFDITTYTGNLCPGVRLNRYVKGRADPQEKNQRYTILTNAASQQTYAYGERARFAQTQYEDGDALVLGNTWRLPVIFGVRDMNWVNTQREKMTTTQFMQQMESLWTGTNSDAIVKDEVLTLARKIKVAEFEHCGREDVCYILSYDIAREEGAETAKSAFLALKLTPIPEDERKLHGGAIYYKDIVNIQEFEGARYDIQARYLKRQVDVYRPYQLVIDSNSYGTGVRDCLMLDLGDGFPPYAIVNDSRQDKWAEPNAVPILYCLVDGKKDTPTASMITTAETEFANGTVRLLVDEHMGLAEYKKAHKLKNDYRDLYISKPYMLTQQLCDEIANLKKVTEGHFTAEKRISKGIQRDIWSALKYAIFIAVQKERGEMRSGIDNNEWVNRALQHKKAPSIKRMFPGRRGRIRF